MIPLILKSTTILLLAAGIAALAKRQSAALRHLVWTAGLVASLAVPLSGLLLPSWGSLPLSSASISGPLGGRGAGDGLPGSGATPDSGTPQIPPGWALGDVAMTLWVLGAGLGILVMAGGAVRLAGVALGARPLENPLWSRLSAEIAGSLGLRIPVRLLKNDSAGFIGTWGILRPQVLLPSGVESWPEARIRMVLGHELAHARRRDWPVQVLAEAARAIYWFNPLFWLAAGRLRSESEQAADDRVLALGVKGTEYAEELIGITRSLRDRHRDWLPVLGMAQPCQVERRLLAVLDPSLRRLAVAPWAILVVVLVAVGLTLPIAAFRAKSPEAVAVAVAQPAGSGLVESGAAGAGRPDALPAPELAASRPVVAVSPDQPALAGNRVETCPLTPSVRDTPPGERNASLGSGPWYVNLDRSIWVWAQPWVVGESVNTVWVRPEGESLAITGRRLDSGDLLEASVTPAISLSFKTGGMRFSAAGCWEVTATAGESTLTFVTEVGP